ncbi:peptidyl-prolyl cis-trans isomerase [Novosphingobium sp. Gsoil 351]|uniref:peptidyl-prolyl cis-trans isomerase n=1 Tax=Novosphingobium sp. Gsoil 351 TaxID=2675225 RepID=UPI0012B45FF8|nr:peptidyl-prolyl cis-trans isomerase [Novosphingobium sp. Gsoil 351]QGN56087.1 hypothetical protein GKE62_17575 [Novosphingobium sp. Gsoil 351]
MILAACGREPGGQVAAVVGDDEITLQEINAEIGSAQIPKGADAKVIQRSALQRIVERRLLADMARDDGLDKQPEFIIRRRQLEDALLLQLLRNKAGRSIRIPSEATLDKYVAAHPARFAERALLKLDQIRFPMPADPTKLRALEADHSIDAVASSLKGLGIAYERVPATLDSSQLPPAVLARIQALPAGEPFIVPAGGIVSVSVVNGRLPAPIVGTAARPIAVQMIRNEELEKSLEQRFKAKKAAVKIEYQPGFEPPKPGKPAMGN